MNSSQRLIQELEEMAKNPPPMCSAGPVKGTMSEWQALILGPEKSPYEGGTFRLQILFPPPFPMVPPEVTMKTKVYHPNITEDGYICLDILKYKWNPKINVGRLLLTICALLGRPNPDDPLDRAKAEMFVKDRAQFNKIAKEWTEQYAK